MGLSDIDYVFESSSEVAHKVGGIYTVLRTKAPYIHHILKDKYVMIGRLSSESLQEIKQVDPPEEFKKVFNTLSREGIKTAYGRWVYADNVNVILLDSKEYMEQRVSYYHSGMKKNDTMLNYVKYLLWQEYHIDSLHSSWDFNDNVGWAWAVGIFLEEFYNLTKKNVIAHFHEWISGAGVLYCKYKKLPIGTVFTTHATVLGRTISSAGRDVLTECSGKVKHINVSEAYRYGVEAKHMLEKATVQYTDIFTTVSETVAMEVDYILGRQPDVITINGMDFRSKTTEFNPIVARYVHDEIKEFIESYFAPYYEQDYSDPIFVFTSGRYEFDNKGYDIYIEALAEANKRLKVAGLKRRIFAFLFVPSTIKGPKLSIIKNYLTTDKIYELLEKNGVKEYQYSNIYEAFRHLDGKTKLFFHSLIKNYVKEGDTPPLCAYDLNYQRDKIIRELQKNGLTNKKDDVVKVIFYPTYLGPADGLLELPYYDIISGMDIGVFTSRYEPYGYTPVEAALKNSIAVTSDMSGFGRYVLKKDIANEGLRVVNMYNKPKHIAVNQLADIFEEAYIASRDTIDDYKKIAYDTIREHTDWAKLIHFYVEAYDMAAKSMLVATQ
ncbi:glycogen/starch synthase [Candidatus Micrarchaeota archaeon]|nr:glycogen/starch synthase [Candidatus Micrarchaeota archaeon]